MNKTTEALAIEALEMIAGERVCIDNLMSDKDIARQTLAAIREALGEPACEHRIADARNEFVKDGYICIKCGALFRAADHAEPVKQEPVVQEPVTYIGNLNEFTAFNLVADGYELTDPLYAAPVDAKAIRAEALDEAAKIVDHVVKSGGSTYGDVIRNLKGNDNV